MTDRELLELAQVPDSVRDSWFLEFERIRGYDYDEFLRAKLESIRAAAAIGKGGSNG